MILFSVIVSIIIISLPLIFIWWFFDTEERDRFAARHEKIAGAVYIGALLSLGMVLVPGIEQFLVFSPDDWGGFDEDGEFVPAKRGVATTMTAFLLLFVVHVFDKFEKLRTENKRLSEHATVIQEEMGIIAEIQKRKDDLRYQCRKTLIEKRDNIEAAVRKLRDISDEGRLSSKSKTKLRILEELLDEINYRIRETEPSDALDEERI